MNMDVYICFAWTWTKVFFFYFYLSYVNQGSVNLAKFNFFGHEKYKDVNHIWVMTPSLVIFKNVFMAFKPWENRVIEHKHRFAHT